MDRVGCGFVAIALIAACQSGAARKSIAPDVCDYNQSVMLAQDFDTFDQSEEGWRSVAGVKGCERAASDLIVSYREAAKRLTDDDIRSLKHHEMQLRAVSGQTAEAIVIARVLAADMSDDAANRAYRKAELAFLTRDLGALKTARRELSEVPEPAEFGTAAEVYRKSFPDDPVPVWPANLGVVDGLIKCFDKPYAEAYSRECQP